MAIEHIDHLADSVDDLNQEVRVLREAIDELRETLQWISQNQGVEQTYSLLRAMGRDVSDPCWSHHLQIETGPSAINAQRGSKGELPESVRSLVRELMQTPELAGAVSAETQACLSMLARALKLPASAAAVDEKPSQATDQNPSPPSGGTLF